MTDELAKKTGKTRWSIMPWEALWSVAEVFEIGAKKYSDRGWETVPNARQVYADAAQRHLAGIMLGEDIDPETGKPHAAHLACCALILVWHRFKGTS